MSKAINYTPTELKQAYSIVQQDLFNSLLSAKDGEEIRFPKLGKIIKKEQKQKCGWDKQTYIYCGLKFKPFSKLKQALNEQIINKYTAR